MMDAAERWLNKLRGLKVDRATGDPAPHKPLLLLVLLDLAREDHSSCAELRLTPELVFRFSTYWPIVAHRRKRRAEVRLPLHHLQSDGCWTAFADSGLPSPHERMTSYVQLNPELSELLTDPNWCDRARRALIATYFQPQERLALYEAQGLQPLETEGSSDQTTPLSSDAQQRGREARFRVEVVTAYGYTCALTGYRLMTLSAGTIVDAAHIHRFSDSRNNDVQNGLALSKNAHWLFDNGLWTISDDYRVMVAEGQFTEAGPDMLLLHRYHGCPLRLPSDPRKRPDPQHLAWHRKNAFTGDGTGQA